MVAALLMVTMLVAMVPAALAWDCTSCGHTGNSGNFCPSCAAPAPASNRSSTSRGISISTRVSVSKGDTTVSWTDSANASPYKVQAEYVGNSGVSQKNYTYTRSCSSTSYTFDDLIPGESYKITITNNNGASGTEIISVPGAMTFSDNGWDPSVLWVTASPRYIAPNASARDAKAPQNKKFVGAKMVEKMREGYKYGLYFSIEKKGNRSIKYSRTYRALVAFYAPNGFVDTFCDKYLSFTGSSNYVGIAYYCIGSNFFDNLLEQCGTIPTGTYRVKVFFDGAYLNEVTFKVN